MSQKQDMDMCDRMCPYNSLTAPKRGDTRRQAITSGRVSSLFEAMDGIAVDNIGPIYVGSITLSVHKRLVLSDVFQ